MEPEVGRVINYCTQVNVKLLTLGEVNKMVTWALPLCSVCFHQHRIKSTFLFLHRTSELSIVQSMVWYKSFNAIICICIWKGTTRKVKKKCIILIVALLSHKINSPSWAISQRSRATLKAWATVNVTAWACNERKKEKKIVLSPWYHIHPCIYLFTKLK